LPKVLPHRLRADYITAPARPRLENVEPGWIGTQNAHLFRTAAFHLRQRTATTTFKWVKGHRGNEGNEESDLLAKAGAEKEAPDQLALDIAEEFNVQGAKLAALNQATAYKGIRRIKEKDDPPCATEKLETIRRALEDFSGITETDETLWRSTTNISLRDAKRTQPESLGKWQKQHGPTETPGGQTST
jgi:RNase H